MMIPPIVTEIAFGWTPVAIGVRTAVGAAAGLYTRRVNKKRRIHAENINIGCLSIIEELKCNYYLESWRSAHDLYRESPFCVHEKEFLECLQILGVQGKIIFDCENWEYYAKKYKWHSFSVSLSMLDPENSRWLEARQIREAGYQIYLKVKNVHGRGVPLTYGVIYDLTKDLAKDKEQWHRAWGYAVAQGCYFIESDKGYFVK